MSAIRVSVLGLAVVVVVLAGCEAIVSPDYVPVDPVIYLTKETYIIYPGDGQPLGTPDDRAVQRRDYWYDPDHRVNRVLITAVPDSGVAGEEIFTHNHNGQVERIDIDLFSVDAIPPMYLLFHYFADGRLERYDRYEQYDDAWILSAWIVPEYEGNRIVAYTYFSPICGHDTPAGTLTPAYDDRGRRRSLVVHSFADCDPDPSSGIWHREEFEYYEPGETVRLWG